MENNNTSAIKPSTVPAKMQFGQHLKCRYCQCSDAWISIEDNRKYVRCPLCQQTYLLKEQHRSTDKGFTKII
jgi:DNA-directed RNA polymerase subunit RPC12/RpoP